jgi:hypothetical protein
MRKITKRAGVIIGVAALGITGGVAWAVWAITGTATATATATDAKPIAITAEAYNLYPGGKVDVKVKSNNPNPFPVKITGFGAPTITSTNSACGAANLEILQSPSLPIPVAPGYSEVNLDDALKMIPNAAEACKNNVFTIVSSITGESAAS